jgi:hypothetical protein
MTKSKLALVAIVCLAFAPAALAEDLDTMPPNSGAYGYAAGSQTQHLLGSNPYDAKAQAPSHGRTLWMGEVAPSRGGSFTAEEKALFDRQSAEIF